MKDFGVVPKRVRQIRAKELHKGLTIVSKRGHQRFKYLVESVEIGPLDLVRVRTQNDTLTINFEGNEFLTVEVRRVNYE